MDNPPAGSRQIPRKGRRGWPPKVREAAQRLYNEDPQPTWAQMERDLKQEFGEYNAPGQSTLRDWEKRSVITKDDLDALWVFGEAAPEDDALVLPVVRYLLMAAVDVAEELIKEDPNREWPRLPGSRQLTRRIARWVVRVRKAAPELDPTNAMDLFRVWLLATSAHRGESGLERTQVTLALAPWRDNGELLGRAIAAGVVAADLYGSEFYEGALEAMDRSWDMPEGGST